MRTVIESRFSGFPISLSNWDSSSAAVNSPHLPVGGREWSSLVAARGDRESRLRIRILLLLFFFLSIQLIPFDLSLNLIGSPRSPLFFSHLIYPFFFNVHPLVVHFCGVSPGWLLLPVLHRAANQRRRRWLHLPRQRLLRLDIGLRRH